jgi:cyclophilin family peptidyl-prolyl cis-trans isomerase
MNIYTHSRKFIQLLIALSLSLSVLNCFAGTQVLFKTTKGDFVIELDDEKAPKTVENFIGYVKSNFYSDTIFHRVLNGFMVQGGGFTKDMQQKKPRTPIEIESQNGLKNYKYTIAMARTSDPNSATSQFFINVKDNAMLDYPSRDGFGYTVFGTVISGMATIDEIKFSPTTIRNGMSDVPVDPITIISATIKK